MSEMIVHGIPGSPFLRAVEVGLKEKNAKYRFEAMQPGEHKHAAYLGRHPFGRIPLFEHGTFVLYETQAILRYIDSELPEPAFVPKNNQSAARMNQIIGINDWYFFPKVAAVVVYHRVIGPRLLGTAPDEAAIEGALPMAKTCITELDRLLAAQPFLAGDGLSIADLILAPQLDLFAETPEGEVLLANTGLRRWLDRMNDRPSMQATLRPPLLRRAA